MRSGNENCGRINFLPKCFKLDYKLVYATVTTPQCEAITTFTILNICLNITKFVLSLDVETNEIKSLFIGKENNGNDKDALQFEFGRENFSSCGARHMANLWRLSGSSGEHGS